MLRPNTTGVWTPRQGHNSYGEPTWGAARTIACAIVNVKPMMKPTPVRTDSSASHAGSDEINAVNSVVLIPVRYTVKIGDKFTIDGADYRMIGVEARRRVSNGKIDHWEVTLEGWQINGH